MMNYYPQNISLFKARQEKMACFIAGQCPASVESLATRSGHMTIKYQGHLIHSHYDPVKTAQKFVESHALQKGDWVVLYGFGMGYHVRPILQKIGFEGMLIIFELNRDILSAAFHLCDLSDILQEPNVRIVTGKDEAWAARQLASYMQEELDVIPDDKKHVLIYEPSFRATPRGFEKIKNAFEILLLERRSEVVFADINAQNLRDNLPAILGSPGIHAYRNLFRNQPAFLISAGPSLDVALEKMRPYRACAWFCCVDTAFPILAASQIRPDFVISIDPKSDTLQNFQSVLDQKVPLLFSATSAAPLIHRYQGPKIVLLQEKHSLTMHWKELFGEKGGLRAGGSVSCFLLEAMVMMGFNPIILVGMDFAFSGMKSYSSGSVEVQKMLDNVHRYQTMPMLHRQRIEHFKLIYAKNKYDVDVPTHQTLYSYLRGVEAIIGRYPDVTFCNFASQGALIKGTRDIFFDEELKTWCSQPIDKRFQIISRSVSEEEVHYYQMRLMEHSAKIS